MQDTDFKVGNLLTENAVLQIATQSHETVGLRPWNLPLQSSMNSVLFCRKTAICSYKYLAGFGQEYLLEKASPVMSVAGIKRSIGLCGTAGF